MSKKESSEVNETTLAALNDTVKNSTETGKRYCLIIGAGASKASDIKTGTTGRLMNG